MARQNVGGNTQGMNAGNNAPTGQPRTFGTDHHTANEDNLNKSTQQRKARTGMTGTGNQASSEDTFNSSTQEHKSHSSTSHETPCGMNPQAEPGLDNRTAQPEFGGGAAAGGSNYNQPSGMQPAGMKNPNTMGKADPQMQQGTGYQQNDIGNQRSGY